MKKISLLFSLIIVAIASFCVGFVGLVSVKANEETFVTNGAGVMITSEIDAKQNGIRFNVVMDKASYEEKANSGKEFKTGVLVLPKDLVNGNLDLVNYGNGESGCEHRDTTDLWDNAGKMAKNANDIYEPTTDENAKEFMSSYVYLYNIPEESLNRNIAFVGYYVYDGGKPVYTGELSRSMAYVANEVLNKDAGSYKPEELAILGGYLKNYEVKFGDVETITVKYGDVITGELPVATEAGKEFAGWVKADGSAFDAQEPIRGNLELTASWKATVKLAKTTSYEKYSTLDNGTPVANANKLTVDVSSVATNVSANGTLKFVKGEEETIVPANKFSVNGTVISIDASSYSAGEGKFVYSSTDKLIEIPVLLVSKIITTDSDLLNWYKYGEYTATEYSEDHRKYILDGYFALGDNIQLGTADVKPFPTAVYGENNSTNLNAFGFVGTFDGQGFVIDGGVYGRGGLFGQVGVAGTIKNVAFTNASIRANDVCASVVAGLFKGTLENVMLDVVNASYSGSGTWQYRSAIAYTIAGGTLRNVVSYYPSCSIAQSTALCGVLQGLGWYMVDTKAVFENVIIISDDADVNGATGYNANATYNPQPIPEHYSAGTLAKDIAVWDGIYAETSPWGVVNGKLSFKKLQALVPVEVETDLVNYELYSSLNGEQRVESTGMAIDLADYVSENLSSEATVTYQAEGQTAVALNNYSINGKVLTVNLAGKTAGEKGVITYKLGNVTIEIPVLIVSKIITTDGDLLNWYNYGEYNATEYSEDQRKYILDGYFVLGDNIQLGTADVKPFPTAAYGACNTAKTVDYGFIGTFDGQGYVINGGVYGRGGLFGQVGKGVIKNVAFTNASIRANDVCANVISGLFQGTLENVLIDVVNASYSGSGAWQYRSAIANTMSGGTFRNVVSYYSGAGSVGVSAALCGEIQGQGWYYSGLVTFENVIIVTNDNDANGTPTQRGTQAMPSPTQYAEGTTCANITWASDFTAEDSIWDVTGTKATFKKANA